MAMSGIWDDRFKEIYTSFFIGLMKTMKDLKLMLISGILAQRVRDCYEKYDPGVMC